MLVDSFIQLPNFSLHVLEKSSSLHLQHLTGGLGSADRGSCGESGEAEMRFVAEMVGDMGLSPPAMKVVELNDKFRAFSLSKI